METQARETTYVYTEAVIIAIDRADFSRFADWSLLLYRRRLIKEISQAEARLWKFLQEYTLTSSFKEPYIQKQFSEIGDMRTRLQAVEQELLARWRGERY